jgi:hypothetical protein
MYIKPRPKSLPTTPFPQTLISDPLPYLLSSHPSPLTQELSLVLHGAKSPCGNLSHLITYCEADYPEAPTGPSWSGILLQFDPALPIAHHTLRLCAHSSHERTALLDAIAYNAPRFQVSSVDAHTHMPTFKGDVGSLVDVGACCRLQASMWVYVVVDVGVCCRLQA